MKKLISLLMALVMVFSMTPTVFAEDDGSVVLFDGFVTTADEYEAKWGAPVEAVAPGDGNITITFDDISEVVPEYRVSIDEKDVSGWQNCLYDGPTTNTFMVAEGDAILVEICTQVDGSYAPATIHFTLVFTPDSGSAEQEIITGSVTFEDAQSSYDGESIQYTAKSNGTLVFNLYPHNGADLEYKFEVSGGMADWYYTYDGAPFTQTAELSRGDTVDIFISISSSLDVYVPGTVDYELIFTPSEEGSEDGEEEDTILELGENNVSIAPGESTSAYYTFIAEEDGLLSIDVSQLIMISPYEGAIDVTDELYNFIGGALYIYVNENYYEEPISVSAGDVVEIYVYQNRMYSMSGYAWEMILNLSMGGNEGGKTEIGTADFFIDEGQEYSDTFTFVPEQDGLLFIEFLELSSYSEANGDEYHTEYAEELLGGSIYLYVNEESYIGDPISVTAGVPVEIYMAQAPIYVRYGYSWYAGISLSIGSEVVVEPTELWEGENEVLLAEDENVEFVTCFHTATKTGTLVIDVPIYMSMCGDEILYPENVLEDLAIVVNGAPVYELPYSVEVTEGDTVTIEFVKNWWAGIGYLVLAELSYELPEAEPTELWEGENYLFIPDDSGVESLTAFFTATETGTIDIDIPAIMSVCDDEYEYVDDVFEALTIFVNDTVVESFPYSVDVNEGDTVTIKFVKNWWAGIGFELELDLFYQLPEIEPTQIVEGKNLVSIIDDLRVESHSAFFTATKTGTISIDILDIVSVCDGEIENVDDIFDALTISINDTVVEGFPYSVEVNEGDTVTIEFVKNWWAGIGYDITVCVSYEESDETEVIYGDVNGDGKVNVIDANLVRKASIKLVDFDENQTVAADVNGDGKINVVDANYIRRFAAKMIDVFPVEE